MNKYKIHFYIVLISLMHFLFFLKYANSQENIRNTVVMISLDGFRWDYPDKTYTPTLDLIAKEGVKAVSLIPSFPSKTFPNHYSIATGLVPDHNGIVNNSFYDVSMGKSFALRNEGRFNPDFYLGEPIWITAQNQGIRTATYYWIGSDVEIQGKHADFWKKYDGTVPYINRIDTILKWLSLPPDQTPQLIMAYFEEPDGFGHKFGPEDTRTFKMVHETDSITGILYNRIRSLPNGNTIDFIVVSDHGMGSISSERSIVLADYIPKSWPVRFEGTNPIFNIYIDSTYIDSVYFSLKKSTHLKVWKPNEVPEYLNYGSNPRVGNIIVLADSAWSVYVKKPILFSTSGAHGYEINNSDMHAIFYAAGPSF